MRGLTIKGAIWLVTSTIATVILIQALVMYFNARSIEARVVKLGRYDSTIVEKSYQLKLAVVQVQQWLTDISATRGMDGLNDGFEQAEVNARLARSLLAELETLDPAHRAEYKAILPVFNTYYEVGKKMAATYVSDGPTGGNAMMGEFDKAAENISELVEKFVIRVNLDTHKDIELVEQSTSTNVMILMVGTSVLVVVLIGLYFLMLRAVINPVRQATFMLKDIAEGEGDLTRRLDESSNNEMGQLAHWFNLFAGKIQSIVQEVNDSTATLIDAGEKLIVITSETKSRMDRQQTQTDMVATAMTEMVATVTEIANSAASAETAVKEADQNASDSNRVINDTSQMMEKMAHEIYAAVGTIDSLNKSSEEIGSVIDVIRDIAEQTNLLALNAAIEAARAGEQGRGFAVVADEVRNLATRTQESTSTIQSMIEQLQVGTQNAVAVMNRSSEHSRQGLESSNVAKQSLEKIVRSMGEITSMNMQIASASEEQSAVAEEINQNMVEISTLSDSTHEGSHQIAVDMEALMRVSNQLKSAVSLFKV